MKTGRSILSMAAICLLMKPGFSLLFWTETGAGYVLDGYILVESINPAIIATDLLVSWESTTFHYFIHVFNNLASSTL